ncbi:RCC1 domain-containing protein 1 isoform X1 [Ascaphus truei]|uniref:RCC1 domain-containing protein 1 isoform X1 n=1 Tax=Ascaphus truei TaxID=8439 RepID=UPI003F596A74
MPRLWFGFGYRGFGQLGLGEDLSLDLPEPVQLQRTDPGRTQISKVIPSWSYTAFLTEDGSLVLSGFIGGCPQQCLCLHGLGCLDLLPTEKYLMLLFNDRVECWDTMALGPEGMQREPTWKMDLPIGHNAAFPLVSNGHIVPHTPFYKELPNKVSALKLVLGNEHAVLLTSARAVLTWGAGRHGQLGHGDLEDVSEPRVVDALHGMAMSEVAAGGWHSVSVSEGGDIYCWGWNESGQLGLPSKTLAQERGNAGDAPTEGQVAEANEFITIQAFPALIDLPDELEAAKTSCGSRHTAVVTRAGNLYTWGWGKYGQLGHGDTRSLDQPKLVEYFPQKQLCVNDVICRHWNTYVLCL